MKLITKEIAGKLREAYQHSAETGEGGKDIVAKFFTPWTNATWYITEGMPVNAETGEPIVEERFEVLEARQDADWHLFGFCDLGDRFNAELGYVMLSDLKNINGPFGLKIERDLHYEGHSLDEILEDYRKARAA